MNKLFKIFAVVAIAATASFAQFNVGGRVAFNFGTVWGDDAGDDVPWGAGVQAGVAGKMAINEMLSFAPELEFGLRRASDDVTTWTAMVIDIPLMLRVSANEKIYAEVGPTLAFLLSGEIEEDLGFYTSTMNMGDLDGLNVVEVGIAAGLGFHVMPNLDVSARFALGLTSMVDLEVEDEIGSASVAMDSFKNMQISVGATYWFM